MIDESALLAAIIADRDADTPRLVFADWLEENGRAERAEFIRVQCELARLAETITLRAAGTRGAVLSHPDRAPLLKRERELWNSHKSGRWYIEDPQGWPVEWMSAIDEFELSLGPPHRTGLVRRGFVEVIQCSWLDWLTHEKAILAATPLRKVRLTMWPEGLMLRNEAELVEHYLYRRWPALEFELPREDEEDR